MNNSQKHQNKAIYLLLGFFISIIVMIAIKQFM